MSSLPVLLKVALEQRVSPPGEGLGFRAARQQSLTALPSCGTESSFVLKRVDSASSPRRVGAASTPASPVTPGSSHAEGVLIVRTSSGR